MYTHTYTPAPCTDYLPSGSYVGQVYPQQASFSNSAEHYLKHIDELMNPTQATYASQPFDLVTFRFTKRSGGLTPAESYTFLTLRFSHVLIS